MAGTVAVDVLEILEHRPITLSDKQQDEIAYKVLALMEEWKLDEDKIVERVLEKFYSRLKG